MLHNSVCNVTPSDTMLFAVAFEMLQFIHIGLHYVWGFISAWTYDAPVN